MESFVKLQSTLSLNSLNKFDQLLRPLFTSTTLLSEGMLKDFNMGQVNSIHRLKIPQLDNPHLACPEILNLKLWEEIKVTLSNRLDIKVTDIYASHALLKPPKSNSEIHFHQDLIYWDTKNCPKTISVMIPTSSTTISNGCLKYVKELPKSLAKHVPCSKQLRSLKVEQVIEKELITSCETDLGDIICHFPLSIHGSFSNVSETSRIVFAMIFRVET